VAEEGEDKVVAVAVVDQPTVAAEDMVKVQADIALALPYLVGDMFPCYHP